MGSQKVSVQVAYSIAIWVLSIINVQYGSPLWYDSLHQALINFAKSVLIKCCGGIGNTLLYFSYCMGTGNGGVYSLPMILRQGTLYLWCISIRKNHRGWCMEILEASSRRVRYHLDLSNSWLLSLALTWSSWSLQGLNFIRLRTIFQTFGYGMPCSLMNSTVDFCGLSLTCSTTSLLPGSLSVYFYLQMQPFLLIFMYHLQIEW